MRFAYCTLRELSMMKRRYQFRFKRVEGTYLFPFEHPQEAAEAIGEMMLPA